MRIQNSERDASNIEMLRRGYRYIFAFIICLAGFAVNSSAQFKEEAFQQTYNQARDTTGAADTAAKLFSFKDWAGGMSHQHSIKIGTMFAGSLIVPGSAQYYNKDYWKMPVFYAGMGAFATSGGYYMNKYNKTKKAYDLYLSEKEAFEVNFGNIEYPFEAPVLDLESKEKGTWLLVGAGLFYWGSILDGVVCYESDHEPNPGRATLYSALLPGLGQIYNGELFKVPIYWGCLLGSVHFLTNNNTNYQRFKNIYNEASLGDSMSPISAETAKWYRDVYRRYRDYAIVATALFYFLQVLDANVFAYMHDFEVTDDISLNVEPTIIIQDNAYAIQTTGNYGHQNTVGLRLGLTF